MYGSHPAAPWQEVITRLGPRTRIGSRRRSNLAAHDHPDSHGHAEDERAEDKQAEDEEGRGEEGRGEEEGNVSEAARSRVLRTPRGPGRRRPRPPALAISCFRKVRRDAPFVVSRYRCPVDGAR
ncbi:hypothetical protein GCM10023322_44390 [Rugosimonospora acidiphila]|uniref:Uncharacterized protein n=1 Tax=Rugosimonospora acidiphila TaxID=556531 RepID=A0ABP9S129_9ACTN